MSNITESDEEGLLNPEPSNSDLMDMLKKVVNETSATSTAVKGYIVKNDARVGDLETKVDTVVSNIDDFRDQVNELMIKTNNVFASQELHKQSLLKHNLILMGIPSTIKTDLFQLVLSIANILEVNLSEGDVAAVYRIANSYSGLIVIKFSSMECKSEFLARKFQTKIVIGDLFDGTDEPEQQIFLNHHVTPHFGKLLAKARSAIKDGLLHSCWMSAQGMLVRDSENNQPVPIVTDLHFMDFMNRNNNNVNHNRNVATSSHSSTSEPRLRNNSKSSNAASSIVNNKSSKRNKPDHTSPMAINRSKQVNKKQKQSSHRRTPPSKRSIDSKKAPNRGKK